MDNSGYQHNTNSRALQLIRKNRERILAYIREKEISEYQGDKVLCVVCKSKFSSFAPYHAWFEKQENPSSGQEPGLLECRTNDHIARCPSCGSMERQRLLWKYLEDKSQVFNGVPLKILEIAPDKPFYEAFQTQASLAYYPCDLYPDRDKYASFSGSLLKEDVTRLSFADAFFDIVLCNHVLEHIPDDALAMRELYRVMKQGGWGIFQVPVDYRREETYEDASIVSPWGREQAFGQRDHVRLYGRDYPSRLRNAGFKVNCDTFVSRFSKEEIHYYGFDPEEVIYVGNK